MPLKTPSHFCPPGAITGLPIDVADAAARLALTPVNKMRVEQASDGMVWAYEGAAWYPAPVLDNDLSPSNVAAPYPFKSQDNPFGGVGLFVPLSTPSTILPQQKWADYIESFVGIGVSTPSINIVDVDVTFIDPSIVLRLYEAQQGVSLSCFITLNCALDASNVDSILSTLDSFPNPVTAGLVELMGANAAPSKQDAFELPIGAVLAFGGNYTRYTTDYTGRGEYSGMSVEYPNHYFNIVYNVSNARWEITDANTAALVAYSDTNNIDMYPWESEYTDGTGVYFFATQLANAAKLSLMAKGLAVNTN